jgi:hypothetical protein
VLADLNQNIDTYRDKRLIWAYRGSPNMDGQEDPKTNCRIGNASILLMLPPADGLQLSGTLVPHRQTGGNLLLSRVSLRSEAIGQNSVASYIEE